MERKTRHRLIPLQKIVTEELKLDNVTFTYSGGETWLDWRCSMLFTIPIEKSKKLGWNQEYIG
ncbi:MAG: hypothetical protein AEth_00047 [Candidatus Argoarchaeum ethanivorans]|uniref:Uncharacterized protein n=1 Tax=Candidatus Argoarchaeum ethanivorans TaxID=2608793 RepID=A0A8B3S434_9EURY|nr:MAG: hypothetical protein AEth_00047 [Candidatus Argoarchaeum ethanivorans]